MKRVSLTLCLVACNVPVPHGSHGVTIDGGADASSSRDGSAGACGRGIVVVEQGSGFASTNVGLVAADGTVLSGSIASSATASVGLSAPLSGDVVPPTDPVLGSEIVLIDQAQSTNRIVWVDVATAARRTLSVETGFWSDPSDYVQLSPHKAYVPRLGQNATPGEQPFDMGSDVLVVDPTSLAVTGSINLRPALGSDASDALPDANKITVVKGRAFVLLGALAPETFSASIPSRLVTLDVETDAITSVLTLDGFENCTGLATSPSQNTLAIFCSGEGSIQNDPTDVTGSGIVVLDISGTPRMTSSIPAARIGNNRVGFYGDFASEDALVVQTFGYTDATSGVTLSTDTLNRIELATGTSELVLDGDPFTIGGVACLPDCGTCFVADAGRQGGIVHRFALDAAGELSDDTPIKVETNPGLPPQTLGKF